MKPDPEGPGTGTLRLLHVGRDRGLATAVADYLGREFDVHVENVGTGETARRRLDPGLDCVLLAQDLPEETGISVLESIRASHASLPVVLYATDGSEDLASEATSAGATEYVPKPTNEPERSRLADRIADAVAESRETSTVPTDTYHAFLEDAYGAADGATMITDAGDRIAWLDDTAVEYFDLNANVVGTDRRSFVRERLAPVVANPSKFAARALDTRDGAADDSFLCFVTSGPDRQSRWLDRRSHRLSSGPYAGGRVDRFTDVTEYVRTEACLRDLQRLMVAEAPFTERLTGVLELGATRLELPYGFVTAIEENTQTFVAAVGDHDRITAGASCPLSESYCRRTVAADDIVAIPDALEAGWGNDPAYEAFSLESYVGVPVYAEDDLYGTFCFAAGDPRTPFDHGEELFVEIAATWTGYELDGIGTANA